MNPNTEVTVNLYSVMLREWLGEKTVRVVGNTVEEVLKSVQNSSGQSVLEIIIDPTSGKVKGHFHILLNGQDIESLDNFKTNVKNGDVISIVPPIGGG